MHNEQYEQLIKLGQHPGWKVFVEEVDKKAELIKAKLLQSKDWEETLRLQEEHKAIMLVLKIVTDANETLKHIRSSEK